jgi:hypothetical protein
MRLSTRIMLVVVLITAAVALLVTTDDLVLRLFSITPSHRWIRSSEEAGTLGAVRLSGRPWLDSWSGSKVGLGTGWVARSYGGSGGAEVTWRAPSELDR